MSITQNKEIAFLFDEIASVLELKGDNPFRIRAYQRAALTLKNLGEDIAVVSGEGRLQQIPGIGKDLAEKIEEYLKTGAIKHHAELKKGLPEGLLEVLSVPGMGPKKAKQLYDKFKIKGVKDLEKLARKHKIAGLAGMGEKTEENILRGIALVKKRTERMTIAEATLAAEEAVGSLKKLKEVKRINPAGSLRRRKETVRDIDILITSSHPRKVMDAFVSLPIVGTVGAHGKTKSSILTREGIQVDVRIVEPTSFGAALVYFTGSKEHNIHLRHLAKQKGLKINEYGVFKEKNNKWIAGTEEKDVYKTLNLPYIIPELREDRGELEAASKGQLPKVIELGDVRGDLHVHSHHSDGEHTVAELLNACKKRGYEYFALTNHSKSLKVAGGMEIKAVRKLLDEIRQINKKSKGFVVLTGTEVDISGDGKIDYPDELLKEMDVVVGAIHVAFKQSRQQLTDRILGAIDNKYINIIAHLTGRRFGIREAYDVDFDRIFKAAADSGTILEINAYPDRLDLNDVNARAAKEKGCLFAICTDTHRLEHFDNMRYGVDVARRGWLEKKDVVNTLPVEKLLKVLRKKR